MAKLFTKEEVLVILEGYTSIVMSNLRKDCAADDILAKAVEVQKLLKKTLED
jgi:hypothetical protein